MILDEILKDKAEEISIRKKSLPLDELRIKCRTLSSVRDFKSAISREKKDFLSGERMKIIAEIKKVSPSKGIMRNDSNITEIGRIYEKNGASAISVLTDKPYFSGDIHYLNQVKEVVDIPVLRKDFIIDDYQVWESRYYGADAILLIRRILDLQSLISLYNLAKSLQMACLVEVHSREEVEEIADFNCEIIGINNRDLRNFQTDIRKSIELSKLIPPEKVIVSESGINTAADVRQLKEAGIDAILVGEALMSSNNIGEKLKSLLV